MSDKVEVRNSVLDKLLGRKGAAEQMRKNVTAAERELDAAGVQHKSLSAPELEAVLATALQAVRGDRVQKQAALSQDDLVDLILAAHEALADVPPENMREAVMQMVAELMTDDTEEIEMALFGEEEAPAPMPGDEEEDKAGEGRVAVKALPDFLKQIIDDQADNTDALIELGEQVNALEAADLPGKVKSLADKLDRVLALISAPARPASQAAETRLPDMADLEKALANTLDDDVEFVAGIPVKRSKRNGSK